MVDKVKTESTRTKMRKTAKDTTQADDAQVDQLSAQVDQLSVQEKKEPSIEDMQQFIYKWTEQLLLNERKTVLGILVELSKKHRVQYYMENKIDHSSLFRVDTLPDDIVRDIYRYTHTQLERRNVKF